MSNKIVIGFSGGLGNQLYNYALGRALSIKFKKRFVIDKSFYNSSDNIFNENYRLDNFNINKEIEITENLNNTFFKSIKIYKRLFRNNPVQFKLPNYFLNTEIQEIFFERNTLFDKNIFNINTKNTIFYYGYWQSIFYFDHIKSLLHDEFNQINIREEKINKFIKNNINENTVAIHIRGGDMEDDALMEYVPFNFYVKSIEYLKKKNKNLSFHIFTDDIKYAKKEKEKIFTNNEKVDYIYDLGLTDLEEFNLMRNYRLYILARSTFSWWASYLSNINRKKVILPPIWFVNQKTPIDRVAENMITMSNDY